MFVQKGTRAYEGAIIITRILSVLRVSLLSSSLSIRISQFLEAGYLKLVKSYKL